MRPYTPKLKLAYLKTTLVTSNAMRALRKIDDAKQQGAKTAAANLVPNQTSSEDAPMVLDSAKQSGYRRGSA